MQNETNPTQKNHSKVSKSRTAILFIGKLAQPDCSVDGDLGRRDARTARLTFGC